MTDFDRLKMKDSETIDEFVGKVSEVSSKSAALGTIMEESKLVKKFLKSLPRRKYIHMVASLEQVLDLNTTSFEDIVGRLKANYYMLTQMDKIITMETTGEEEEEVDLLTEEEDVGVTEDEISHKTHVLDVIRWGILHIAVQITYLSYKKPEKQRKIQRVQMSS